MCSSDLVSTSQLYDITYGAMRDGVGAAATAQRRIASGQRLERVSEDPGAVVRGSAIAMFQAQLDVFDANIGVLDARYSYADQSLGAIGDALSRIETMCLMSGVELPARSIREQISSAIHLVVQQARLRDGSRRITHITEVVGMEGDIITTQDLFTFDYRGSDGKDGILVPTGIRPTFVDDFRARNLPLPTAMAGITL